ncbi:KMT5A methyltransferase, partial [Polypterus senegalus]
MMEFLKKSGLYIHNVPPAFRSSKPMEVASAPGSAELVQPSTSSIAAPAPVSSQEPQPSTSGTSAPALEECQVEEDDVEYDPLNQDTGVPKWTTEVRKKMVRLGLYQKHSSYRPLIMDFARYLKGEHQMRNCKQECDNVCRFLFYMDKNEANINFIHDIEKTRAYFRKLNRAGLTFQTIMNYMKSVKRFTTFILWQTNFTLQNPEKHSKIKMYMDHFSLMQKTFSKQVAKEIAAKRYRQMNADLPTPRECHLIFKVSKRDFLSVISKLLCDEPTSREEHQLVLYYLEAVIVLGHLQRPGVVKNMTVSEWVNRKEQLLKVGYKEKRFAIIGVKEHKTSIKQMATLALNEEEEQWFDLYFVKIRKIYVKELQAEDDPSNRFFLSTTGNPIYNPCNDLNRLHRKYKIKEITAGVARRVLETAAKRFCNDIEKSSVADYLAHSNATAEKHYRLARPDTIARGKLIIQNLMCESSSECETTSARNRGDAAVFFNEKEEQQAYENLVIKFPVTLDGEVPKKKKRKVLTGMHHRMCCDRWRAEQEALRCQHILSSFCRRQPTLHRIEKRISQQVWTTNIPSATKIHDMWKPEGSMEDIPQDKYIQRYVSSQKWKGLAVCDNIPGKGRGVYTSRRFQKGEVVCDYHGRNISRKEGKIKMKDVEAGEMGYLYFCKNSRQEAFCIDAQTSPCPCHLDLETFGRLINHSSKRANLQPHCFTIDTGEGPRDVVLFIANKDIGANKELLFDYGVKKKSFKGEGMDLDGI